MTPAERAALAYEAHMRAGDYGISHRDFLAGYRAATERAAKVAHDYADKARTQPHGCAMDEVHAATIIAAAIRRDET